MEIVAAAHALNPATDLGSWHSHYFINIVKFGLNSVLAMLMYKRCFTNFKIRTLIRVGKLRIGFLFWKVFSYIDSAWDLQETLYFNNLLS